MIGVGDIVKHKKDKLLIRGKVMEFAKSGVRVKVEWKQEENPRLLWRLRSYYRLDLLEVTERAATGEQGPKGSVTTEIARAE